MNALNADLNTEHLFQYKWKLSDGYPSKGIEKHGLKVFGSFLCGGGSTMGYKLAGYEHLGGIEIDKKLSKVYKENHNPKYYYNIDIRQFNKLADYPAELFSLDIFDGSPPCSSFSTAGNREKDWGKKKTFREGQSEQILDDLFFHWIDTVNILRPKVAIAENVSGLIKGNAKGYVVQIFDKLKSIGYNVQLFHLNAASMGVPQKRERVFFICSRADLNFRKLNMKFNEKEILFAQIKQTENGEKLTGKALELWNNLKRGERNLSNASIRKDGRNIYFGSKIQNDNECMYSIIASKSSPIIHRLKPYMISDKELILAGSFPLDYKFLDSNPKYIIGMSVPPVMTAQIAHQVYLQWFK